MSPRLPKAARRAVELSSRFGYASRGLVYVFVGAIALLAALDLTPRPSGATDAIGMWANWPLGLFLITAIAFCLVAFSGWRVLQAVFDADHHGTSPKGWAVRIGQAVSGLVYGLLAWSVLELLDGFEDIGEADETDSVQTTVAQVLAFPHGDWIMIAAGLALFAVGIGNLVQGAKQDFAKRLDCSNDICRWVVPLARIGYIGRGLATFPLGVFLFRAGIEVRSSEARSWADAMQAVEDQPFGSVILGLLAFGLIAFGLFGLAEARYRHIEAPGRLKPA